MTGEGGRQAPLRAFDPADRDERETYVESYAQLLRRATMHPETLTTTDHDRLEPADKTLIVKALDRELAKTDAQLNGFRVREPRIGANRRKEILAATKRGEFKLSQCSDDEMRAIENTPGLAEEIFEAIP